MKKIKNNKKKKGFTLIELVIVLAVLAIIALIAIPNFTKVRNDSLSKSDLRSAEQIEKITLMAIADEDLIPDSSDTDITLSFSNKRFTSVDDITTAGNKTSYEEKLRDVKAPQVNNKTSFVVRVDPNGEVSVGYSSTEWLAGKNATGTP